MHWCKILLVGIKANVKGFLTQNLQIGIYYAVIFFRPHHDESADASERLSHSHMIEDEESGPINVSHKHTSF